MRKTRKNQMFKGFLMALVFTFGVFTWCSDSVVSLAAGTAKVVASSGKIREKADTGSDTIASVKKGDKLDVIASKTDDDGYTWYKVYVDDEETGYIRADLVTVDGTIVVSIALIVYGIIFILKKDISFLPLILTVGLSSHQSGTRRTISASPEPFIVNVTLLLFVAYLLLNWTT